MELESPAHLLQDGLLGSFYFLAQWFPKVGVLEDAGWNCHQFHAGTEFFADYGVYDVRMTVPGGWVVGSSGLEQGHHLYTPLAPAADDLHG